MTLHITPEDAPRLQLKFDQLAAALAAHDGDAACLVIQQIGTEFGTDLQQLILDGLIKQALTRLAEQAQAGDTYAQQTLILMATTVHGSAATP